MPEGDKRKVRPLRGVDADYYLGHHCIISVAWELLIQIRLWIVRLKPAGWSLGELQLAIV